MRILINGWECDTRTPNKLLRDLTRLLRVEVNSLENLKIRFSQIADIFIEFSKGYKEKLKGGERAKWTRAETSLLNNIKYWGRIKDRESFIKKYYDFVLALEGKGTLPGFGFTNAFGDTLKGNPERESILKVNNLIDRNK